MKQTFQQLIAQQKEEDDDDDSGLIKETLALVRDLSCFLLLLEKVLN